MADFCMQCSIEHFGEDCGDLANIGSRPLTEIEKEKGMGWSVLCEGCGATIVDDSGRCISANCLLQHGVK